jgi:phosphoglycerol transferase MdoB-like AlkP superfamily enzyme
MREPSVTVKKINGVTFIASLVGWYWILNLLQRITYAIWIYLTSHEFLPRFVESVARGFLFDLAATCFMFAPLCLWFLVVPKRFGGHRLFRAGVIALSLMPMFIACFAAIGEIFFFDEFHARYNFIAVDYLIYTTEVIRNIVESYSPLVLALAILGPLVLFGWLIRRRLMQLDRNLPPTSKQRWKFGALAAAAVLCAAFVTEDRVLDHEHFWPREISKNSLFTIFAAYFHNSINYHEFYVSIDTKEAHDLARSTVHGNFKNDTDLTRAISNPRASQKLNVVLVAMESMSAGFLAHFGNKQPITPNLDNLADQSLFFTNFYATGTRTVRGLEALMLSMPPTPGQSILRRPNSDNMFNLGTIFREHGYQTQFVYGGYAYFDNMKEWFESNHFQVVDRNDFPQGEIHFGNAWGVCDEDLFTQVLKQEDAITQSGKNFFQVVLTTSNHRPYTFPEGRIDMQPHTGREAAIKYSDYAIGKFIDEAKAKPWFKNTIFIFVADHDASVAGGTDIPVKDFLIPAIVFSPANIQPEKINKLASQIDLGPTLLGLVGFSYTSKFFGEDLRRQSPDRAYLGTYQKVSRLTPHHLEILSPGRQLDSEELDDKWSPTSVVSRKVKLGDALSSEAKLAVGVYQSASDYFVEGLQKVSEIALKP